MQLQLGQYIPVEQIKLTGLNPRKTFNEDAMKELARSIQVHGILEPLVVRPRGPDTYELVAGERRLRAAKIVGLKHVPVVIKECSDEEIMEVMLLENLQRQDLKPLEEAAALEQLLKTGVAREELAAKVGKSPSWISGRLRLQKLPEKIKQWLDNGNIGVDQAMMMVPYAKWPAIEGMIKELEPIVRDGDYLTKSEFKWRIIDSVLSNRKYALNLDNFGYGTWEAIQENFDFSECKKCKAPIEYEDYGGEKERLCLNQKCFRKKVREARKKVKEKEQKKIDKLAAEGIVDLSKMRYDSYRSFSGGMYNSHKFDTKECRTCPHRKMGIRWLWDGTESKEPVCLKPSCFDEKQEAAAEEEEKRKEHMIATIKQNMDKFTGLNSDILRFLLHVLIQHESFAEKVMEPWAKKEPKKGWKVVIKQMPEEELPHAIIRALAYYAIREVRYGNEGPINMLLPELLRQNHKEAKSETAMEKSGIHEHDHNYHRCRGIHRLVVCGLDSILLEEG